MQAVRHGILLLLLWTLAACSPPAPLHQQQAYVFGTLVEVSIYGVPEAQAAQAAAAVLARFDESAPPSWLAGHDRHGVDFGDRLGFLLDGVCRAMTVVAGNGNPS